MKVLVVDDDLTNRLVLKAMLDKDGHEVILAEHGEQGVELFKECHPDMVLMDVMMPVMDGYDATRIIKEGCNDTFIPVIFITAVTDDAALAACIECGGDDFITKPFNRIILRAKISALERIRGLYATILEQKTELSLHNERFLREQELAERIYDNIVYQGSVSLPHINSTNKPAEKFSGDVMLSAITPGGDINVLMGDVTGHGLSAAICVMPVAEIFSSMSAKGFSMQDILVELNCRLKKLLPTGMFLAAALVQVNAECRLMRVWNGGIPDILIYGSDDDREIKVVPSQHLPMGIVGPDDFDSQLQVFEIIPGDRVMLYTDGLIEASCVDGTMFTQDRLLDVVRAHKAAGDVIGHLDIALNDHCAGIKMADDVTMLELICDPALIQLKSDVGQNTQFHLTKTWKADLELQADALKSTDPVPLLVQFITGIQGFNEHRSNLFTILSELYNNAFDHGVLNLDSSLKSSPEGFVEYYLERERRMAELEHGNIRVMVENTPGEDGGCLVMSIEDSGKGFVVQSQKNNAGMENNMGHSGRGVPLVKSLCKELVYANNGTRVKASYSWE